MFKRLFFSLLFVLLTAVVVFGAAEPALNVALVWHQHQPLYFDPAAAELMLPWVRMHAIKDYYDMAAVLKNYPDLKVTFNLVPILLEQLALYESGELIDRYQIHAQTEAADLTEAEKEFLLQRFFDANWDNVIARFPRYLELLEKRGTQADKKAIGEAMQRFTEQDYLDLQVWFNLAWFDPDFLQDDPKLAALVQRGRNFTEADKAVIHSKQVEIINEVVDVHRRLQEAGQIEIITTPYSHPILPLLYNTELAGVASPDLPLPEPAFAYPEDIKRQLELALANYQAHFGQKPRGLWPSEQAVSKHIIPYIAQAGFDWLISSEGILENSLGLNLRGIDGVINRPDLLYQPYWARWEGERAAILFRDIVLSDRVGFEYSGVSAKAAVEDLTGYLHRVRMELGKQAAEKVVVIALDGENAWEHYENDGKEFFAELYGQLSADPLLRTVTISQYLDEHPPREVLDDLWTGSWIGSNLETWIGEEEENIAWQKLALARQVLGELEAEYGEDPEWAEPLALAWRHMLAAQGSDWFWWYGDDQDSGNDEAFDALFRAHVRGVYESLGLLPPKRLSFPLLVPKPALPAREVTGLSSPIIDGWADYKEWEDAAVYKPVEPDSLLKAFYTALDYEGLSLRFDWQKEARALVGEPFELRLYLGGSGLTPTNESIKLGAEEVFLGFPLGYKICLDLATAPPGVRPEPKVWQAAGDGKWQKAKIELLVGLGGIIEMQIPFAELGYEPGDAVRLVAVLLQDGEIIEILPAGGPVVRQVPRATAGSLAFLMKDPVGDDYGPGSYVYPTSEVFAPGVFDLTEFAVYETEDNVAFHVKFAGPIENVWNSPNGLSVQTIDIYIDTDRVPYSGSTEALAGRRVKIAPDSAWEYAIWVEGWHQKLFRADGSETGVNVQVLTDSIHRRVIVQVPKSAIGTPQAHWGYLVLILGQEGFPASDSLRVREVLELPQEWRFGGGHDGIFDPNVIDLLALPGEQEKQLAAYDPKGRLAEVRAVYQTDLE